MKVLGIETSCDETSAAVLSDNQVLSNIVSSQEVHLQFGGVVPELASRAHLRKIIPIVERALQAAGDLALDDIDAYAVTHGPGLVGALLVGLNYVKGLSMVTDKPFIGVNHIEGHIYSNLIDNEALQPPMLCLLVSGGHTQLLGMDEHLKYRLIGTTRDDAVGEAFDKTAKMLGLPYPGGPEIDRRAKNGYPDFISFPIGLKRENTFDFSYSGLKTAVLNYRNKLSEDQLTSQIDDICASFQAAAVEALVQKTIDAARTFQYERIAVAGGVAANSRLREQMQQAGSQYSLEVSFPAFQYCTDNAAMIARAGLERLKHQQQSSQGLNAFPSLPLYE